MRGEAADAFHSHDCVGRAGLGKLAPGDTAAFFFAGHGVEFGGRNYLLPRDVPNMRPGREELLRRESLSVQEFMADLREKGTRLNLVILDACRDNPFEQVAGRSVGSVRGLAVTEPPEGAFIMFSAGSGESALDHLGAADSDPNSVYTRQLLPLLRAQGMSLTEVAEQVRVGVRQVAATVQHKQTPAYYNQVLGRVCLSGGDCGGRVAAPASTQPQPSEAERSWLLVKDATSVPALEAFIGRYKDTFYAELARARIEELKKQQVAIAAPSHPSIAAQDYPNRSIKIIVPFGPSGPADIFARYLGQHLQESLKQSFVVENQPGAGAIIGTSQAAKSPPDGYTLLMMSNTHTANETLRPNKPFQLMRDFVPVAPVNYSALIMVVHPSVPAKDLKAFLALAKSKPGGLNYASSGPGTPYHMAGELFKAMSGTDIVHVPHKTSGEARAAVIACHVQMMIDPITAMAPAVQGGQVRALGTTGRARSGLLPDVPTIAEAGVPGYEATIWYGVMAPAATPKLVVDRLNAEINKVLRKPEVKEVWAKQGAAPLVMSPPEFEKYLRGDIEKWAKII
jgi:tripartite-type tricarboxylate transporter receptor subunit TctC